ncbi:VOC family protein [Stenotrophomonas rhizophila]|uniref:VOC family protein n=1 Tax=Stenotrophomonas rhizophila TaxID=216778 RepID=UPI001E3D32D5|nr:VOC family protein [Stenotrophomonas rhizophila]MCC7634396.1 VOC family protein [Stenotrophomonas rhizophila]MCC7663794.1 VOC family protein [Stenotrophomonas rhizophila]
MRIEHLTLPVSDPTAMAGYFQHTLELPVEHDRVQLGWTTLQLLPAGGLPVGGVHLAFNVPHNRFAQATAWLDARAQRQRNAEGQQHFTFGGRWDSESIYFTGPDGLILELIGRRRLPGSERRGAFHGSEITCISEVGLPAASVADVQARADAVFGLQPLSPPTPRFAALGDDEGLLIVTDATRRWFPEQRVLPNAQGLHVRVSGVTAAAAVLDDAALGWCVQSE